MDTIITREVLADKRWHGAADAGDLPRPALIEGGYVLIPHTSWATYESMLADKGDNSLPRLAYLDGLLEIRMPLSEHEDLHRIAAVLVNLLLIAWEIDARDLGGMTHNRGDGIKGFEPDTCFHLAGQEGNPEIPMLAMESDISNNSLNKLPLYAAWQYREVWRFALSAEGGVLLTLYVLTDTGYVSQEQSETLAPLTRTEIAAWVQARVDDEPLPQWARRVNRWASEARRPGQPTPVAPLSVAPR